MESRVERAQELFRSGYNCAQSVFAAYADLFGMDRETALKISCPMGAGIGRMREVCGTVCAMSMLSGFVYGNTDPEDEEAKKRAYEIVRRMAQEFQEENGTLLCRELLGAHAGILRDQALLKDHRLRRPDSGKAPVLRKKVFTNRRKWIKIVA